MMKNEVTDQYVLDTLQRTISRMSSSRDFFLEKFQHLTETLQAKHPNDVQLVKCVFAGSLRTNKFAQAAKMASKLANNFGEPKQILSQIQLLYMDSQHGGSPMSLQFAIVFADKYLASLAEQPSTNFGNLYLKLMLAKKDFDKSESFLTKYDTTFRLWLEKAVWQLRIKYAKGMITETLDHLE